MKKQIFKLLSVVMALAMVFSVFACVVSAEEPEVPDTGVKVNPTMTQGTIDKGKVYAAVVTRVHTADFIYVTDIQSVSIGKDYKASYHFYDKNGVWVNGHIGSWQIGRKTGAELAEMVPGAIYVKIVLGKNTDAELYPEGLGQDAIVVSLVDGLNEFTKPDLPEVKPELPPLAEDPDVMIDFNDYIYDRGNGLANTFAKLNNGEKINVLYMGGSVTNGTGASERELTSWRGIIGNWLAHNAGKGKVNNVNAAYGDTCSLFGAYRLNAEILPEEPDLIFVEFAINDMYNSSKRGYDKKDSAMQYETIIRGIRKAYPDCDIVTILITERGTLNPDGLQEYAQIQENLAIAYDIPSIHLGRALAKEIKLRGKSWSDYSGDSAHPNDLGYSVYAGPIKAYLDAELKANGENTTVTNHKLPTMVSDKLLDGDVQFIDANDDLIKASEELGGTGFAYGAGATNLANSGTNVFKGGVFSKNEEDVLAVKFTGTELAMIEYQAITGFSVSVDGGEFYDVKHDTVKPVILATGLEKKEHIVVVKPTYAGSNCWVQGFFTRDESQTSYACKESGNHEFGKYVSNNDASCTSAGTETAICTICKQSNTRKANGEPNAHTYKKYKTTDATTSKDGKKYYKCSACGKTKTSTIYKASKVYLSTEEYTYNGSTKKPSVKVYDSKGKKLDYGDDYTYSRPSSSKKVGKYKIKVTFKGDYTGSKTLYYTINPKGTKVSSVTAAKKSLKVKISKQSSQTTGYQIQYSTSSKFKSAKLKTISSYKTTSYTIKSLSAKKYYYVRVRTYKTVDGKKYYSDWSKSVKKKTK
jgi:lysophospholipase L1-like esterase